MTEESKTAAEIAGPFVAKLLDDGVSTNVVAEVALAISVFVVCMTENEEKKLEFYEEFVRQLGERCKQMPLVRDV